MADWSSVLGTHYTYDLFAAIGLTGEVRESRYEDRTYFALPQAGISLICDGGDLVTAIQLFGEHDDDYAKYTGSIPNGLAFEMTRPRVRDVLGVPLRQSESAVLPILGRIGPWDLFVLPRYCLHVQYSARATEIELVTLTLPA